MRLSSSCNPLALLKVLGVSAFNALSSWRNGVSLPLHSGVPDLVRECLVTFFFHIKAKKTMRRRPAILPMTIPARRPESKVVWVSDLDVAFASNFAGGSMVMMSSCAPRAQLH